MGKELGNPQVGILLQDAFELQGRIRMQLEESIVPTISLGDLSKGFPPPITRHASAVFTQAAVALERPVWRLEMPGSGIALVRSLYVDPDVSLPVVAFFGSSIAAPGTAAVKSYTDGRILADGQLAAGVLSFDTQVAALGVQQWRRLAHPSPDQVEWNPPWIVGTGEPGLFGFIEMSVAAVNVEVRVAMSWDEYQIF